MLTHLSVNNFTLVDSLDIEVYAGMTAITGETGAGKSIVLGALGMALGDRADADQVRAGAPKAEIHASFDTQNILTAQKWLQENELGNGEECLLRRVITAEGRSRGYINGQPATIQQLRTLGEMLIDIHSQHEHQSLLKKDTQRRLLDEFAGHIELSNRVKASYRDWQSTLTRYSALRDNAEETSARHQLLSYQVEELNDLCVEEGECEALEAEHKTLSNAENILQSSQQLAEICSNEDQCLQSNLNVALQQLRNLPEKPKALNEAQQLLSNALIQVEEAHREIENHIDSFELSPERLLEVENRLSALYDIARKHRIHPHELPDMHAGLNQELSTLSGSDAQLDQLEAQTHEAEAKFRQLAGKLSKQRKKAAIKLSLAISEQLKSLAMTHAHLEVALHALTDSTSPHGLEEVEFLISPNSGQSPRPLAKIASGGELSRISLAIQVITAQTSTTPTLVFDEVDVGIGGATADVVGHLLRKLGAQGQVVCVTHLAQVASKAHQHLQVSKQSSKNSTQTRLSELKGEAKVAEIARMLGGASITAQSRAHAKEMMDAAGK